MNKMTETNLEHYKEGLKEIFRESVGNPFNIYAKIGDRLDRNIASRKVYYYTDVILEWMAEPYKEPILDDVEKEYLSAVIKPFRNKIMYIAIYNTYSMKKQYVHIGLKGNDVSVNLPYFKANTLYKGMEANKHYSLEELGL